MKKSQIMQPAVPTIITANITRVKTSRADSGAASGCCSTAWSSMTSSGPVGCDITHRPPVVSHRSSATEPTEKVITAIAATV